MLERWPLTSLLNVFIETDLRTRFTDVFCSATACENLGREIIRSGCFSRTIDWDQMPGSST